MWASRWQPRCTALAPSSTPVELQGVGLRAGRRVPPTFACCTCAIVSDSRAVGWAEGLWYPGRRSPPQPSPLVTAQAPGWHWWACLRGTSRLPREVAADAVISSDGRRAYSRDRGAEVRPRTTRSCRRKLGMAVDLGKAGSSLRCEGRGVGTEGRRRGGVGCSHRPLAPLACSGCPLKSPHAVFFFFFK